MDPSCCIFFKDFSYNQWNLFYNLNFMIVDALLAVMKCVLNRYIIYECYIALESLSFKTKICLKLWNDQVG